MSNIIQCDKCGKIVPYKKSYFVKSYLRFEPEKGEFSDTIDACIECHSNIIAKCEDSVMKDNSPKTYLQDFTAKFPSCEMEEDRLPNACRNFLYGKRICNNNCFACWNEPMSEGNQ